MRPQTSHSICTNDELALAVDDTVVTERPNYTDDDMIIFTDKNSTLFSPTTDMDEYNVLQQETSTRIQVNKNRSHTPPMFDFPRIRNREHQLEVPDESGAPTKAATNSTKKRIRESDVILVHDKSDCLDTEKLSYEEDYFLDISFQEAIDNASR
jgi:hypothetical protein